MLRQNYLQVDSAGVFLCEFSPEAEAAFVINALSKLMVLLALTFLVLSLDLIPSAHQFASLLFTIISVLLSFVYYQLVMFKKSQREINKLLKISLLINP
ncbi:hypothetical protein [Nostoc piscinale]|uniref:hypothetical protein n=1 Tax=Nostoc piscinale TaxID=224012 RepID=UPI0011875964|nr:hypothetical protein [Nostoc piscinale]